MASQIYSRYVPPKRKNTSVPFMLPQESVPNLTSSPPTTTYVPSKSSKRRKIQQDALAPEEVANQNKLKRQQKTQAGEQDVPKTGAQPTDPGEGELDDQRHKRLMEKREKSLKKAAKLARKAAKQAETEGEEEAGLEPIQEDPEELHGLVPLPQPEPAPETPLISMTASLPPWLASPLRVSPTFTAPFSKIGIQEEVEKVLYTKGFKQAFAVQAAVLPLLLPGRSQSPGDILVSAATGSGKTLAYVLPMIQDISMNTVTRLRGLIVMPTRELVTQAKEVCEVCAAAFSARKRVKIGMAVGNEAFKTEQISLLEAQLNYDPAGYKEQLQQLNAKWESSDIESGGENEFLCDDEDISSLPDHVITLTSKVDILICTPGRLVEHLKSTPGFSLDYVEWLVVDEADKLLDQSFQQWLETVMARLTRKQPFSRRNGRIRKVVLSATMTRDIGQLNSLKLHRPKLVVLESSNNVEDSSHANILPDLLVESAIKADESLKPLYLIELLQRQNMISPAASKSNHSPTTNGSESSDDESSQSDDDSSTTSAEAPTTNPRGVLVFTKSNETAIRLARLLALLLPSYSTIISTLSSTTSTSSRRKTIHSFNAGKFSIIVASDLVSRGLDLQNLAHVINYDVPSSITNYVHRVGRTARAGKMGWAWTIFMPTEGRWFWNEIARSKDIVRREGGEVQRINIDPGSFGDEARAHYEAALEKLGREAKAETTGKSKKGKD